MEKNVKFSSAKLVSLSKDGNWSQSFSFESFYCTLEINGQAGFETPLLGKQLIEEAQKIYLLSEKKDLQLTKKILAAFKEKKSENVSFSVSIGFKNNLILYLGTLGKGKILVKRGDRLLAVLTGEKETETASGIVQDNDIIVLETESFAKTIKDEELKTILDDRESQEIADILAPEIQSLAEFGGAATVIKVIIGENREEQENKAQESSQPAIEEKIIKEKTEFSGERGKSKLILLFKKAVSNISHRFSLIFSSRPIYVNQPQLTEEKRKKTIKTIVLILIALFGISLIFSFKKKTQSEAEVKFKEVYSVALKKKDEGKALIDLNPVRARRLFSESRQILEEAQPIVSKDKKLGEKLSYLLSEVNSSLETTAKVYKLKEIPLFFDFQATDKQVSIKALVISKDRLFVFKVNNETIYSLKENDPSPEILVKGEELKNGQALSLLNEDLFLLTEKNIYQIKTNSKEKKMVISLNKSQIKDFASFTTNLYLLDPTGNQILKYILTDSGFSQPTNYLKEIKPDFSGAVSLTIDGAIYVLKDNGEVLKFLQGKPESFKISGLDINLNQPKKIFTTEDLKNIYLLDSGNSRVVVIDKKGEYQSQYINEEIGKATTFVVSSDEKQIFIASGTKIYRVEVK